MEELTKENYATNHDYLSFSRLSRFMDCEAAAAAGYHEPPSDAQLVGSYVDAYFSDELDDFKAKHPEILNSKTGALKKDFIKADTLIKRIESDEMFMSFMSGQKQVIMTGIIDDIKFKIKMDSYNPDKFIVDLKVMKDFEKVWTDNFRSKVSFVEAYNYDIELAIFQEIVRQNTGKRLPCYLACITKEEPSDVGIFEIPQKNLDYALGLARRNLVRVKEILEGKVAPHRCEKCSYCRGTKKARIMNIDFAGYSGDALREEGIECDDPKINIEKQ